ncbi:MAG: thioesterase family protein [Bacteroidota bacterium]|nr:thioesterase family protein [Bacteroidota bacterium]
MIERDYTLRVKYPDTDQMGTVHHSNYAKYYETARWELLRSLGISYHSVEEAGYMLPVISMNFKFLKTTHYDEQLRVHTTLKSVKGVRVLFAYKLFNEKNELINEAETELAFVKKENWRPCGAPDFFLKAIAENAQSAYVKN